MASSSFAQLPSQDLYSQATSVMLDRSFPSPRVEYLLLDLRMNKTIAIRWHDVETPIPVGSLLKPFVALAYGQAGSSPGALRRFPVLVCHGKRDGCWHAGGHGSLTLERAIAESCNAYFLALARDIAASRDEVKAIDRISVAYGLPAPSLLDSSATAFPKMLIGATPEWRVSPVALAHAYGALATNAKDTTITRLMVGMKMAAMPGGTAAKVLDSAEPNARSVLAKTGTAPCVRGLNADRSPCVANGDGLVVVLTPAEHPALLLLVRQRGTTGAQAAELAGRMLSRLEGVRASAH